MMRPLLFPWPDDFMIAVKPLANGTYHATAYKGERRVWKGIIVPTRAEAGLGFGCEDASRHAYRNAKAEEARHA